jgi:MFS family permease
MAVAWSLVALAFGGIAYSTQQMGLFPILPRVGETFGVDLAWATWTVSAFLLASAVATPVLGKLGDLYGRRRTLIAVLSVALLGTVLAAVAPNMPLFIAGRVLQGLGSATFALGFALARDLAPEGRSGSWIAILGATFALGGGTAMAASGFVADEASWRWLLWIGVPMHALAIAAVLAAVPATPVARRRSLDVPGAALLAVGVATILVGLTESDSAGWGSPRTILLIASGAVVLAAWFRFETLVKDPLVPAGMLARPGVGRGNVLSFITGFITFGALSILSVVVAGPPFSYDASTTGLLLALSTLPIVAAAPLAGVVARRLGPTIPAVTGLAAVTSSMAILAAGTSSDVAIWGAMTLLGLGVGATFLMATLLVVDGVGTEDTALSAGLATITRLLGGVLGAQLAATLVAGGAGYPAVFLAAGVTALPVMALLLRRPSSS